jgi:hypothetical protein
VAERFTFNIGPGDRLLWVLEKLELAAAHLEDEAPPKIRLDRALLEMHAVFPRDLPDDLGEQLTPIRAAMRPGATSLMTTAEAEAVGQAILRLWVEVQRRIEAG